ncbi:MAG: hypothetical protein K1X51_15795 [Rhodospirillaceae bacterium]|nr:hypothetical protein [Rhodospirillaceae bacterium]
MNQNNKEIQNQSKPSLHVQPQQSQDNVSQPDRRSQTGTAPARLDKQPRGRSQTQQGDSSPTGQHITGETD